MIAFPSMLVSPAKKAGMKVPDDLENYDKDKYAHFHIFEMCQIGAPMPYPSVAWDNAKVVASLSDEETDTITYKQLLEKGFQVGYSRP